MDEFMALDNVTTVLLLVKLAVGVCLATVLIAVLFSSHHQSFLAAMSRYTILMRFWTLACSTALPVERRRLFITLVSMLAYVRDINSLRGCRTLRPCQSR